MPSLKTIRKRITSVKSTQKVTRAMKMVAGARLHRAQQRITDLRPYAVKLKEIVAEVVPAKTQDAFASSASDAATLATVLHPLLADRPEKRVLIVLLTSDRGQCGAFNANAIRRAEIELKARRERGQEVILLALGRKGRDYFARRDTKGLESVAGVWDRLGPDTAKRVSAELVDKFLNHDAAKRVDAVYMIYSEFKSAMTQKVTLDKLLPVPTPEKVETETVKAAQGGDTKPEYIYEPSKEAILGAILPMYVEITVLRALYESMAGELGARMTAMDSATKNAKELIESLTLEYNKARQAAITKELMEIVSGTEALKD